MYLRSELFNYTSFDAARLMRDYAKAKNIPQSEVFGVVAEYWNNQPSVDGSITDMVAIWFICTSGKLTEIEIDKLFEWFYA